MSLEEHLEVPFKHHWRFKYCTFSAVPIRAPTCADLALQFLEYRRKFVKSMKSGSSSVVHSTLLIHLLRSPCDHMPSQLDLESILTDLCWLPVRSWYAYVGCFALPWRLYCVMTPLRRCSKQAPTHSEPEWHQNAPSQFSLYKRTSLRTAPVHSTVYFVSFSIWA